MTAHCAYDTHGQCPESPRTCSCTCHWDLRPPFGPKDHLAWIVFFGLPVILFIGIACKP
jgi:hypothetical protein